MKSKSTTIINQKIHDPNWTPMEYTYGDWFISELLKLGFHWEVQQKPHFKLRSGDIIVTISPYPNVVIVDKMQKGVCYEIYCHSTIPTNQDEFDSFFKSVKKYI